MATSTARSDSGKVRRVAVVGGGVAGSMTAARLADGGVPVDLFCAAPVRRSHSVLAQGGISAGADPREAGDSSRRFFEETIAAGGFLANQPPVMAMIEAAPAILDLFDRMGVPFHRTPEGLVDRRRLSGSSARRAAYAGSSTGQQMLAALDEQLRRLESEPVTDARGARVPGEGLVRRFEDWELIRLVTDDAGTCVGLVAQDLRAMTIKAYAYDAVILATGGPGGVFGRSAYSATSTGAAVASAVRQGAVYANGEFIQVHPTAIGGPDKLRVVSESLRSEGARLWVPKDKADARAPGEIPERERDYFLERAHADGGLAPMDVAARAIHTVCSVEGRGVADPAGGPACVYLDVTQRDQARLRSRAGSVLDAIACYGGVDPLVSPVRVRPAVHYSMGGLWVDYEADGRGGVAAVSPRNHATTIPGLYAVGEAEYQYHGASRLGGGSLLSCAFGAGLTAAAVAAYRAAMERSALDLPQSIFDKAQKAADDEYAEILKREPADDDDTNAYGIHDELGVAMTRDATVARDDAALDSLATTLTTIESRAQRVAPTDTAGYVNQGAPFVRALENMVLLARVIVASARQRAESRGAHHKPAVPQSRAEWLRTTLAVWRDGAPAFVRELDYACAGKTVSVRDAVDTSLFAPPRAADPGAADG
mgnify:CR=1 FL=1